MESHFKGNWTLAKFLLRHFNSSIRKPRTSKPGWSFTNPSAYGLFSWVVVPRTLLRLHVPLESAFRMPGNLWRISKRVVLLCDELIRSSSDYGDFWIFSGASDNSAASD